MYLVNKNLTISMYLVNRNLTKHCLYLMIQVVWLSPRLEVLRCIQSSWSLQCCHPDLACDHDICTRPSSVHVEPAQNNPSVECACCYSTQGTKENTCKQEPYFNKTMLRSTSNKASKMEGKGYKTFLVFFWQILHLVLGNNW